MSLGYVCAPSDNLTLILSHYWTPIGVTSAKDAIRKLCRDSEKSRSESSILALDRHYVSKGWKQWLDSTHNDYFEDQPHLRSTDTLYPVPTILLTTAKWSYNTARKPTVSYMYKRYKGVCQICGEQKPAKEMSVEHILPKSLHGTNDDYNLTLTCKPCNNKRGNIFPYISYTGKPLRPPKPLPFLHVFGVSRPEWKTFLVSRLE